MHFTDFEQILADHVLLTPERIALHGSAISLSYGNLQQEISQLRQSLALETHGQPLGIAVENHPAWVVIDIAALGYEMPSVPIPFFFTDSQILHAVIDAGVGTFITDQPERFSQIFHDLIVSKSTVVVAGKRLMLFNLQTSKITLPKGTVKITYTSGTTGNPKGVCLSAESMLNVAVSVVQASRIDGESNHLCVLPLATLLENVAGVYATLIAGATIHLLPSHEIGLIGSQLDIQQLHHALLSTQANTAIFIPELLSALVVEMESKASALPHLRFLAVGGAAVAAKLLERAKQLVLPVYQGYGLSECASVVALNTAKDNMMGSVGKAMPHVEIKLAEDHEIMVKGTHFLGYTGDTTFLPTHEWLPTGDIGSIDTEGYLYIKGRKKNIFITSYGRNVSPEWVECVLLNSPYIAQACIFGEAKPWNVALIVSRPNASDLSINQSIDEINQQLPDYARISKWIRVDPFTPANQQLTLNGRLKREAIYQAHQHRIHQLYKEVA